MSPEPPAQSERTSAPSRRALLLEVLGICRETGGLLDRCSESTAPGASAASEAHRGVDERRAVRRNRRGQDRVQQIGDTVDEPAVRVVDQAAGAADRRGQVERRADEVERHIAQEPAVQARVERVRPDC